MKIIEQVDKIIKHLDQIREKVMKISEQRHENNRKNVVKSSRNSSEKVVKIIGKRHECIEKS